MPRLHGYSGAAFAAARVRVVVAILLCVLPIPSSTASSEPTLQLGIQQVRDGNFSAAVVTLDVVILKLASVPSMSTEELATAHLHKGVSFVGLAQEEPARASFKEALRLKPSLRLSEREFPPRVVRVFEATRKGKSKTALYATGGIGLGAIAIGAGVAVAAAGSAAAVVAGPQEFSGTVSCSQSGQHPFSRSGEGSIGVTLLTVAGSGGADSSILVRPERWGETLFSYSLGTGALGREEFMGRVPNGSNPLLVQHELFGYRRCTGTVTYRLRLRVT